MALRDTFLSRSNLSQKAPKLETSNFNISTFNLKKTAVSNSIPPSGLMKIQLKNSSLANSHGILRKDPANLTNEGLGLNPNINVEDEYIGNLLQQVHFLGLEIKLIKEKQEEEKGKLGVAGLLSKDGKPVMDHLIHTEDKYKILKETSDQKIAKIQNRILLAENESKKLSAMKEYMLDKLEEMKKSHDGMVEYFENTINDLKIKYAADQGRKEEGEDKYITIKKTFEKTIEEHSKRKKDQDLKKLNKDLNDELFKEEEKMYIDDDEFKTAIITKLEEEINTKREEMKKNFKYQECLKQNQEIKNRLRETEKELDDINYKAFELEHLQALSVKQKEADMDERRKLAEDIEKAKDDLNELKKTNVLKIEKKLKESESPELKKLQDFYKIQENILNDLKVKFEKVDANMKKLKTEMYHKQFCLEDLLIKNEDLKMKMGGINEDLMPSKNKYLELKEKIKEDYYKLGELKEDREKLYMELKNLQKEYSGLNASFKHFAEHVKLDEDLHNVDLEQLAKVTNSNNQINEAISDLMGKWDGIKKFSKNAHSTLNNYGN